MSVQEQISLQRPGAFCWHEVVTDDTAATATFYSDLFGWRCEQPPHLQDAENLPADGNLSADSGGDENTSPPTAPYSLLRVSGRSAAGLRPIVADDAPHWLSFIASNDVASTLERAVAFGSRIVLPITDQPGLGRIAVFEDPQGARLALYEVAPLSAGRTFTMATGAFCWNELTTAEPAEAVRFYTRLFGWTTAAHDMGGGRRYTTFFRGEQSIGGVMPADSEDKAPLWMPYIDVPHVDATASLAESLGGTLRQPPMDIPSVGGRFALLTDPQGAHFAALSREAAA